MGLFALGVGAGFIASHIRLGAKGATRDEKMTGSKL